MEIINKIYGVLMGVGGIVLITLSIIQIVCLVKLNKLNGKD